MDGGCERLSLVLRLKDVKEKRKARESWDVCRVTLISTCDSILRAIVLKYIYLNYSYTKVPTERSLQY